MSRDQKAKRPARRQPSGSGGGVIIGLFIGLIVGALVAAGAAWYLTRSSPFQAPSATPAGPSRNEPPRALPGKPGDRPLVKQDFEFYKILPQGTGTATAEPVAPVAVPVAPLAPQGERLYLQAGAFEDPSEADNMKALLALNGIEASAQRAQLADGRIVHRVRVGPFDKPEDMNPVRARMASAGLTAAVVRVAP